MPDPSGYSLTGFGVCRELKRSPTTNNIPVMMLTARGEEVELIAK
jgi:two-component system phosphate regulon response regulator PhoB